MSESKVLSLNEFLDTEAEDARREFVSEVWRARNEAGEIIPGKLVYRLATVGDREYARRQAKHGEKFDNAKYGCALISRCVLEPQIPPMEADKLQKKNGKEMDRLLSAILGEGGEDPQ
jgi:hypothetical protein